MITIAIADQDLRAVSELKQNVEYFFKNKNRRYSIDSFPDLSALLQCAQHFDLVLLENVGEPDFGAAGIRKLKQKDEKTQIVFVTAQLQSAIAGYDLGILDFIYKPARQEAVNRVLGKVCKKAEREEAKSLVLKTQDGIEIIDLDDVIYLEVLDHNLVYHTRQGNYQTRGQFSSAVNLFKESKFQICNRSCMVNFDFVSKVDSDDIVVDGTRIPISRAKRKEIAMQYKQFSGDQNV